MIFSIIVPVCNAETFLEDSVMSAISQKLPGSFEGDKESDFFEIILLENGSKDSSPEICDRLAKENRNVHAIHMGRIGLYAARQHGIRHAKGDYILALDADDRLLDDALLRLAAALEKCKEDPGRDTPDLIIFDAAAMGGDGKPLFERPFDAGRTYSGDEKKIFFDRFCTDDSLNSMWTKCIKRSIADLGRTDLFLGYGEDLYQTAGYLSRAGSVMYLDEVLYEYRVDAASMSTTYSEVYLDNQKIAWKGLDEVAAKWEGKSYDEIISRRKSLTCTIAMTRLIYSDMSMIQKRHKLEKLLSDPFYVEYSAYPLPDWAPEEAVFVKKLQMKKSSRHALLQNAFTRGVKNRIKGMVKHGI
jgi:glycosyltransferase involved in cell wall biosynthesis